MGESILLQNHSLSISTSYSSISTVRSNLTTFPRFVTFKPNQFSTWTGIKVVSDTKSPVLVFDSQIQPETGGGDGGSSGGRGGDGGGGGGGGGGGDGFSEGKSNKKKGDGMSMSQKFTLGYALLVGVGGLMGYMKTGSTKSLAAGGISAAVLGYVYTALPTNPTLASAIGLGISAALLAVMGSRFKKSGKVFPAGVVSVMSLIMTAGYLHGIVRSGSH